MHTVYISAISQST